MQLRTQYLPVYLAFLAAFVLGCAAAIMAAHPAFADWQGDLRRQLMNEYNCEVAFLTRVEVRKVDGREVVFVRAHCTDKRAFDANRQSEAEPFKVKACDVQAC
jgi:hypothetical protein